MPFVALDRTTNQRVDITQIDNPREALQADVLICPLCEADMIVVAGPIVIHHFRHKIECTSDMGRHPESIEHLRSKAVIARKLKEWFGEFTRAKPELEVPIPEANRVADILFSFPNGWRVACEIQLASITTDHLQQRTNDYYRAGVDVFWFLGKSASTPANRDWSIDQFGYVLLLDYDQETDEITLTPEPVEL